MTNLEFEKKLKEAYSKHPIIAKSEKKSINELSYVLRMTNEDYCLNITDGNGSFMCVPSVKETFIPTHILAQKIETIEFDEEISEEDGVNLVIILAKDS